VHAHAYADSAAGEGTHRAPREAAVGSYGRMEKQ
jgi:hypothetical protein